MKKSLSIALAAVTALSGIAIAGEASAQRYRGDRHYDRRHHDDGAAIALGVLAGAALAGNGNYYARPYGYYGRPHYRHHRGYGYGYRRCWTESRWDPYYGRTHYRVCR